MSGGSTPRILVTGATGFVGRPLVSELLKRGYTVRAGLRSAAALPAGCEAVMVGEIGPDTDWRPALAGVDRIVHLAARVHVMRDRAADPLAAFRRINRDGTRRLADQAAATGVRRLVFLSSIKAMIEDGRDTALGDDESPCPGSPYGQSKWEAEQALAELAATSGLEVAVLRPPLVYGPEVKGNFLSLLKACARGLPLPLGAIDNRRSIVYLGNLIDAITRCLDHPAAIGRSFLIQDGAPLSTPELLQRVGAALGRPARLLPIPPGLLAAAAGLVGKSAAWSRLAGSLFVDDSPLRLALTWQPPFSTDEGLKRTADWFTGRDAGASRR
ncbi:MAG: NAD-dependent epimerase/dehydratase family protein [Candidatus Hydrogenedens sp.]|nr:NAD-dependent epimerase/dehydratase family protein [Candidatus Hydrogenedens sp.]